MKQISQHNQENKIKRQFEDPKPLIGVVVISNESFDKEYPLESRSYKVRSDNKYFLPNMGGSSIYAHSLDDTDHIRLDWYLGDWKIEYCYILEG